MAPVDGSIAKPAGETVYEPPDVPVCVTLTGPEEEQNGEPG